MELGMAAGSTGFTSTATGMLCRGVRGKISKDGSRPDMPSGWPVAGLEKGAGEDPCFWDQLWPLLLGANNELDSKQPAWIFYLPSFCAEERNQKD